MADETTSTGERRGTPGLGVILLTVFLDLVGFSIIFPLFPEMLEYYLGGVSGGDELSLLGQLIYALQSMSGASGAQSEFYTQVLFGGLLGSVYSLLTFLAAPVWGALSDRFGRRQILVWTIAGTALSYALWVVAGSFALLLFARVIGGLASGNISVASAAIADVTDARSRTKAMGMLGAAFGVGFIVGPALGGGLSMIDLTGALSFIPGINPFSAPALAALLLALWNLVWVVTRFPETRRPEQRQHSGDGSETRRPINPLALLQPTRLPGVDRTNLIYLVFIVAFAGMEFTLTFLARDRFAYTSSDNVYIFLWVGLLVALVQGGVVRQLAPRIGELRMVQVGFGILGAGLVVVGVAATQTVMYLGLTLLAVGTALASPALTSLVSLYAPEHRQGEILGVFRSLGALGRAIAPIIASLLYWRYGSTLPYVGGALAMLIPLSLSFGLPKRDVHG